MSRYLERIAAIEAKVEEEKKSTTGNHLDLSQEESSGGENNTISDLKCQMIFTLRSCGIPRLRKYR